MKEGGTFVVGRVCLKRRAVIATGGSGMQPLTSQTRERNREGKRKKRKPGEPDHDRENHIMSSEFYDSLLTKSLFRKTLLFAIVHQCLLHYEEEKE